MKRHQTFTLGWALGAAGLMALCASGASLGGMMDGGNMKEMMQDMMSGQLPPGIAPEQLPDPQAPGARLLVRYCAQCHNLPGPGMHSAEEWPGVVARMNSRMQMMSGRGMMGMMHKLAAPSADERLVLTAYLQQHAQKTIDAKQYPDLNSPAGKSFQQTCSQCHALPDPKQHTASEWQQVVQRMTHNMTAMGKPIPSQATVDSIVGYLQSHAK